jgi:ribose/xylose/arabinose/galactoside ABC-type transport system permease subunit
VVPGDLEPVRVLVGVVVGLFNGILISGTRVWLPLTLVIALALAVTVNAIALAHGFGWFSRVLGLICGLVGVVVLRAGVQVPSIIVTLGMLTALRGLTKLLMGSQWLGVIPPLRWFGAKQHAPPPRHHDQGHR